AGRPARHGRPRRERGRGPGSGEHLPRQAARPARGFAPAPARPSAVSTVAYLSFQWLFSNSGVPPSPSVTTFWWKRAATIWYAIARGIPSLLRALTSSAMTLSRADSIAAITSSIAVRAFGPPEPFSAAASTG